MKRKYLLFPMLGVVALAACNVNTSDKSEVSSAASSEEVISSSGGTSVPSTKESTATTLPSTTTSSTFHSTRVIDNSISSTLNAYVNKFMTDTTSYIPSWNQESFKDRWNYIDGVFLTSMLNLYKEKKDATYLNFVKNYVNYYIDADGNFVRPDGAEGDAYLNTELDSVCESRILYDLYAYTKDTRYTKAIENTYAGLENVTKCVNGINFSHKNSYLNQIWLDGFYMYVPYYVQYAGYKNDSSIYTEIYNQYKYVREHMYDSEKGLYYHGHDTNYQSSSERIYWASSSTGNSKSFWLRAIGWYLVSLTDSIEYFPDGEMKDYLISILDEGIKGVLQYKDAGSNMFYQLVDKGNKKFTVPASYLSGLKNTAYADDDGNYYDTSISNYLESSGSSMIAYVCLKASRLGYIDAEYTDTGEDIFKGVYNTCFKDSSLSNICITAGLGPATNTVRDGSVYYYLAEKVGSDDAKGTGPFIMAYTEYLAKFN